MVNADAALFTALAHYFTGLAHIQRAEVADDESEGLRQAAPFIEKAHQEIQVTRECEERLLELAEPIEFSGHFVRRHEVASLDTAELTRGFESMMRDLAEGYYPAEACGVLNRVLARLMPSLEQNARIEGVLRRFEDRGKESEAPPDD